MKAPRSYSNPAAASAAKREALSPVATLFAEWARATNKSNVRGTSDANTHLLTEIADSAASLLARTPSENHSDVVLKQWVFNYESYADGGLLFEFDCRQISAARDEGGSQREGRLGSVVASRAPRTRHEPSAV